MFTTLPSSAELPCSDDTPVDNEEQNLLPNLLLFVLRHIWHDRQDWFFGVDMGIYHTTGSNPRIPVIPDAFLSLGVPRKKGGKSRLSYVMWEENYTPPILVLEMVSHTPGKEYSEKMAIYQRLGVLYYVIYNPEYYQRDGHEPFEVYKLVEGEYQQQRGEPYWMAEVGLGIGRCWVEGDPPEQLAWFDREGKRFLTPDELLAQERQEKEKALEQASQALQAKEKLAQYLRAMGIDPDRL
ncbi:MAG: Uma2 family endonuclease [Pseudanabaenaceae cyanobacterium SKYGB_i_bin29]|nr:Uma2 family endonuclease [Pseudanabaenaceae cyanobacterium SKYG29]MDW8422423.1 Uma2 family endonuclease [Pseudanabaenaceae cyanobacterium SKYGB_i_bin29]